MLVSIRENAQRCAYFGIPTARIKTVLLIGAAMIAALAGYAYAAYTDVIAPDLGNFQFGTELVIWVALGGRGTLIGPAIAAVLIDFVSAYLSGSLPFIWQLVVGTVFIAVIVLMPSGSGAGDRVAAAPHARRPPRRRRRGIRAARICVGSPLPPRGHAAAIAIADLSRRYGSLHVLDGIIGHRSARRAGQPGRAQRRGQDDADPLHQRRA